MLQESHFYLLEHGRFYTSTRFSLHRSYDPIAPWWSHHYVIYCELMSSPSKFAPTTLGLRPSYPAIQSLSTNTGTLDYSIAVRLVLVSTSLLIRSGISTWNLRSV